MTLKDLHNETEQAEKAVREFMRTKPDLSDTSVRAVYLPLKARLNAALTALGSWKDA